MSMVCGYGICSHTCIHTYTLFSMSSCQLVLLELLISQSYFYAYMCVHTHVSCAKAWISNTICFMKSCAACIRYCIHVLHLWRLLSRTSVLKYLMWGCTHAHATRFMCMYILNMHTHWHACMYTYTHRQTDRHARTHARTHTQICIHKQIYNLMLYYWNHNGHLNHRHVVLVYYRCGKI